MNNTLTLTLIHNNIVQTDLHLSDNTQIMEVHNAKLNDERVLMNFVNNQYYRQKIGRWTVILTNDNQKFDGDDMPTAVQKALAFINNRDNPDIYVISYF